MKRNVSRLVVTVLGALAVGISSSRASLEVSGSVSIGAAADFYAPLAPEGGWVEVGSYGRCWRPSGVSVGWRPYCDGTWVWTDCGWYWQSDEPWAWACYHYGWWVMDPVYGWIWVPGVEWAPAWVEWRVGGGYIGWAPLPPRGVSVALSGPQFVFVQANRFQDRVRPSRLVINNTTVIQNTKVINNLRQESRTLGGATSQKVMVNEGPNLAMVRQATGKKIDPVSVRVAAGRTRVPASVKAARRSPGKRELTPPASAQSVPATPEPRFAPAGRGEPWDAAPGGSGRDSAGPMPPGDHGRPGFSPPGPPGGRGEHHGQD